MADQHDRLEQRPHHVVDRLADERRGVVGDLRSRRRRGSRVFSSSILARIRSATSRALVPGQLKDGQARRTGGRRRCSEVVVLRAQLDAGHVAQADDAGRRPARPAGPCVVGADGRRCRAAPGVVPAIDARLRQLVEPPPPHRARRRSCRRRRSWRRRRCSSAPPVVVPPPARAASPVRAGRRRRVVSRWSCRSRRSLPVPGVVSRPLPMVTPEVACCRAPCRRGPAGGPPQGGQAGGRRVESVTGALVGEGGWPWPTLTMMSPNCSVVVSRPRVSIGSSNGCVRVDGRLAELPGRARPGSGCGWRWPRRWRSCSATPASADRARRGCCSRARPW